MAKGTGNLGYNLAGGSGGGLSIITPPSTPGSLDISLTSGSTNANWQSVTFVCFVGTIDIGGVTFNPGTYTYDNTPGTLASISYDASASTNAKLIFQQ
jgi:hypothetical protein